MGLRFNPQKLHNQNPLLYRKYYPPPPMPADAMKAVQWLLKPVHLGGWDLQWAGAEWPSFRGFPGTFARPYHGTNWTLAEWTNYWCMMVVTDLEFHVPPLTFQPFMKITGHWDNTIYVCPKTGDVVLRLFNTHKKNSLGNIKQIDPDSFIENKYHYHLNEVNYWTQSGSYVNAPSSQHYQTNENKRSSKRSTISKNN